MHHRSFLISRLSLTVGALVLALSGSPLRGQDLSAANRIETGFEMELDPAATPDNDPHPEASQAPVRRGERTGLVFKDQITPHWFADNTRFWYRNDLPGGASEFVLVTVDPGGRAPAFDHEKLARSLSKATGTDYPARRLPFRSIDLRQGAVHFQIDKARWKCDLQTFDCVREDGSGPAAPEAEASDKAPARRGAGPNRRDSEEGSNSADGKWSASVKDHNIVIRARDEAAQEIPLSRDGSAGNGYGRPSWAPDGQNLVAFRTEPGERKDVYLVESSPQGGGRAKLQTRSYTLPGDKLTTYELNVFALNPPRQIKPAVDRIEHEWIRPRVHWQKDGHHFAYEQIERGHQRFRVIEVDAHTGVTRDLIDERSQTFIWTAHTENLRLSLVNWLTNTDELIYVSEQDGWRHLYLIDPAADKMKKQITRGEWVVRGIERIDEPKRQIWVSASGRNAGEDPYLVHYYRVNFDGGELVALTGGNGNHEVQYSPDRKFLIDSYSRADLPPVSELRRTSDGSRVCPLEAADITELQASGWEAPEVFVAKGRDQTTDIWGLIYRPRTFDPDKKYPVIEDIYGGPQGSFVPKSFSPARRYAGLTDLGFIVVKIDGMGTANRSKAFHDVCWKNLKDAGLPDRILWIKAAAAKYPALDLARVGVYGNSAGGQNAAAAVLFHPEFYQAAVASCGCHDNRMDKASWNEQWMGYPVGPQYAECSNIDNAYRLQGKLFLIVGELDNNVPPESTYRFVDALIKADKTFDLLVVPGGGHGMGGAYGQRRMQDFFVRHFLGREGHDRQPQ